MPTKKEALPTQDFIEVDRVQGGALVLKNGSLRKIIMISGTNFDLASEEEQEITITAFQGFLNALNFSIQIFIHSRKTNIDAYIKNLDMRETQESNELLKTQITEYKEFIKAFVSENSIMTKSFFIVVPYDPLQIPESGEAITTKMFGFLKKKGVGKPDRMQQQSERNTKQIQEHIEQLNQRVDQVINRVNQMNLRAVPLNDNEVIELFYNLYNPESIEKKHITTDKNETS